MSLQSSFSINLYNSKSRTIETFTPQHKDHVGMYVCGPTVYGDTHLGNARPAVCFDVLFRFFTIYGYKVRYVRNITDVGHLEDEQLEQGEDKIAKKARIARLEPMEISQRYTNQYKDLLRKMNVLPPSIEPLASGHMIEQQEIVRRILDEGYAYEQDGSIYFNLQKYAHENPYGNLSGKKIDDLLADTRGTAGQNQKRSPLDFALWKAADPSHIMRWPSPWGEGFPGWHLECTAMSTKYLGKTFDIHGGGLDLQFPHHEAEIAQNCAAYGSEPARFWLHNNMLTINGQKMSKSLGNFVSLQQLFTGTDSIFSRPFDPVTVRFFLLQAHYRSPIDLSEEALEAAEKGLKKLQNGALLIQKMYTSAGSPYNTPANIDDCAAFKLNPEIHNEIWSLVEATSQNQTNKNENQSSETDALIQECCAACWKGMASDANTPRTIAALFDLLSLAGKIRAGELPPASERALQQLYETYSVFFQGVLGLGQAEKAGNSDLTETLVQMLIDFRNKAREEKNWAEADRIRDGLADAGVRLLDGKNGTEFQVE